MVPVPKADGSLRLCGDYKVTINPQLEVDQFPVPTPEDLFATLAGGQEFTKLDFPRAYQQVVLEPSSRKYLTINTHMGLYQYTRLPFGVASGSANNGEAVARHPKGSFVYLDDTGSTREGHMRKIREARVEVKAQQMSISPTKS